MRLRLSLPPLLLPSVGALVWLALGLSAQAETLRVGGTGAANEMLRHAGTAFAKAHPGSSVEVVPSLGSSGAISAVIDDMLAFAVAGRLLQPEESAKGLVNVVIARTPFGLATSHPNPIGISSRDAAAFFASENSVWHDMLPVRPILRPKSDSDTVVLGHLLPGMEAAIERVRARPYIPMAATDQDNAEMAERVPGSLVGMTLTQVLMEKRDLRFVPIDGVAVTLENFERGAYPYGKEFYLIFRDPPTPTVKRFLAFLHSATGQAALRESGNLPAEALAGQ